MSMMSWPGHIPFPYHRSGLETVPHNAKIHFNYGNFLRDTGRTSEAIRHYRTAIRYPPSPPSTFCSPPSFSFFSPSLPLLFISLPSPLPPGPQPCSRPRCIPQQPGHTAWARRRGAPLQRGCETQSTALPRLLQPWIQPKASYVFLPGVLCVQLLLPLSPPAPFLPFFRQEPGETGRGRSST